MDEIRTTVVATLVLQKPEDIKAIQRSAIESSDADDALAAVALRKRANAARKYIEQNPGLSLDERYELLALAVWPTAQLLEHERQQDYEHHGTRFAYEKGCRCEQCRTANAAASRGYPERVKLRDAA